jgi:hypothetical protein
LALLIIFFFIFKYPQIKKPLLPLPTPTPAITPEKLSPLNPACQDEKAPLKPGQNPVFDIRTEEGKQKLDLGVLIPESGEYFFCPNWYCAACGMRISMVTPLEKPIEGRFHGDCKAPGQPTGPFFKQSLGNLEKGDLLIFQLASDHYTLGNVTNKTNKVGLCNIDDISTDQFISFLFTCDDGYNMPGWNDSLGFQNDIQFKVVKRRSTPLDKTLPIKT